MATSDVLETERTSFLGFTHELVLSSSTMELVAQLTEVVLDSKPGDRRVRRYFEYYDTPFVGERRSGSVN
ncbi:hypothetical protein B5X24_HaOG211462 [Helicoverpa armigera]|nr:hypothetical protein B5X24_HaOG211462 [Helicoverpa armigera]